MRAVTVQLAQPGEWLTPAKKEAPKAKKKPGAEAAPVAEEVTSVEFEGHGLKIEVRLADSVVTVLKITDRGELAVVLIKGEATFTKSQTQQGVKVVFTRADIVDILF